MVRPPAIREIDVVKSNGAIRYFRHCTVRIGNVRFFVQTSAIRLALAADMVIMTITMESIIRLIRIFMQ